MKDKKGPLGTPLGNPVKFFREQRESRLPKADSGMGIMNHHLRNMAAEDAYNQKVMEHFGTQGNPAIQDAIKTPPGGYTNTTKGEIMVAPTRRMK